MGGQIDQGETFDDLAFFNVLFYDLGHVLGGDLPIPDALGVDENGDADRAKAHRAAVGKNNFALRISALRFLSLPDSLFFQDSHKFGLYLSRTDLRTRFSVTDENVPFYRSLHHWGQLFELVSVVNKLLFNHEFYFATNAADIASKQLTIVLKSHLGDKRLNHPRWPSAS